MGRSVGSITGAELVAYIAAQFPALTLLARVENGMELSVPPNIRIIVGSKDTVRKRQYRDKTRDNTVPKRGTKRGTKANLDPDLCSSGSVPDPNSGPPDSSEESLSGSARVPTEHYRLRQFYAAEFLRIKKVPHKLTGRQGGRFAASAAEMIETFGFDESCSMVRRALADSWQAANAPELWDILKNPNKFRGQNAGQYRDKNGTPKPGSDMTVEQLFARAEEP